MATTSVQTAPTTASPEEANATAKDPSRLSLDDLDAEGVTTSVERAAQYLGVSRAFGYQMAREGVLPVIRLGARRFRVPTAALRQLLAGTTG